MSEKSTADAIELKNRILSSPSRSVYIKFHSKIQAASPLKIRLIQDGTIEESLAYSRIEQRKSMFAPIVSGKEQLILTGGEKRAVNSATVVFPDQTAESGETRLRIPQRVFFRIPQNTFRCIALNDAP